MFEYQKRLEYPVNIATPNPALAKFIISQYGGPDGELGASLRYLSQRYSMPYPELKGLLTDIGMSQAQMYKISMQVYRKVKMNASLLSNNAVIIINSQTLSFARKRESSLCRFVRLCITRSIAF